jgi:hypothetical protein
VYELWTALANFILAGLDLAAVALRLLLVCLGPLFALFWCLLAIDWRKLRPDLESGAAIPLVLLGFWIAAIWAWLAPRDLACWGLVLPNFVWQCGLVAGGIGLVLFCGWLQLRAGWFPEEVPLFPTPTGHGHDGDGHQHH